MSSQSARAQTSHGQREWRTMLGERLDLPTVQHIFRSFRGGLSTPPNVIWEDMTAMFQEPR